MPVHQLIEQSENIAKRRFFSFVSFRSGLILAELIPALTLQNQKEVIESLKSIDSVPLHVDWGLIRNYQTINLQNGINKAGIPDLLILQQLIENNLTLFTLDKHFALMQPYFYFRIL